jgi:hypothetical protein
MHADSIAINSATPTYPVAEITPMMKLAKTASIFSVIPQVSISAAGRFATMEFAKE